MIDLREYVRELHMRSINKTAKSSGSRQHKMVMRGGVAVSIAPSSEWGGGNALNDFMYDNKSKASKVSIRYLIIRTA